MEIRPGCESLVLGAQRGKGESGAKAGIGEKVVNVRTLAYPVEGYKLEGQWQFEEGLMAT